MGAEYLNLKAAKEVQKQCGRQDEVAYQISIVSRVGISTVQVGPDLTLECLIKVRDGGRGAVSFTVHTAKRAYCYCDKDMPILQGVLLLLGAFLPSHHVESSNIIINNRPGDTFILNHAELPNGSIRLILSHSLKLDTCRPSTLYVTKL